MKIPVIETDNLTKYYGKKRGIKGINLKIKEGEIFGYLGPNAAGKTTTIRLLIDFIRPSSGQAFLFGLDSRKKSTSIRKRLGYLPGELSLYNNMTVKEMLLYFAQLRQNVHWPFVEELTDRLKCDLEHSIRTLSQGNKQKVGVIQAMMHKPDLLILDEPTNGLDPLIRQEFYHILLELNAEGKTIFLSSHVLPEVEKVCDRVGIIRGGKIVAIEDVLKLKEKSLRQVEIIFGESIKRNDFSDIKNIDKLIIENHRLKCLVTGNMNQFIKKVSKFKIIDFSSHQPGLEEIFLAHYGESENVS